METEVKEHESFIFQYVEEHYEELGLHQKESNVTEEAMKSYVVLCIVGLLF